MEDKLKNLIIPGDIKYICIQYFIEKMDTFSAEISSPNINIIQEGLTTIGHTKSGSAFGWEVIDPMSNMVYIWTFQIIRR